MPPCHSASESSDTFAFLSAYERFAGDSLIDISICDNTLLDKYSVSDNTFVYNTKGGLIESSAPVSDIGIFDDTSSCKYPGIFDNTSEYSGHEYPDVIANTLLFENKYFPSRKPFEKY